MTRPAPRAYGPADAAAYALRSDRRHRAELALLARALREVPAGGALLDVPCGTARLGPFLAGLGFRVTGCDRSPAMLARAGAGVCADAARLPFRDRAFPVVVSFRFLHHLPPPALPGVLAELARVSSGALVVSFFHPASLHGWRRRLAARLRGRPSGRYGVAPRRLAGLLAVQGLCPRGLHAQCPLLHELWVGVYARPG